MRLLLETHTAAWWWDKSDKLPRAAVHAIEDAEAVFVSAATAFEMATKHRLGKWPETGPAIANLSRLMREARFTELPAIVNHGVAAGSLPGRHRDPFDRLLAAQAQLEGLTIVTGDAAFALFGTATLWSGHPSP